MYAFKRRGRRTQDTPPTPEIDTRTATAGVSGRPNSSYFGSGTPADSALADKMHSRMSQNFPGIESLSRGSGRPLELPGELRENLESHFGASLDSISFRESSDASAIGAKAYARGDEIHFAPGQFRPDTEQGRKMIGHEVSHIRRQASSGMGNGVLLDASQEHQADVDGDAIASGNAAPLQSATAFSPMPVASFDAAPAQGWGLKEHGILTELARKKASAYAKQRARSNDTTPLHRRDREAYQQIAAANDGQGEFDSDKAKRSLAYGAKFNDVGHHDTAGFVLNYMNHKSAFINQTHHGDMQFLHSMDTSGGDTKENMAKAQRYAKFASDVYQNKQDQTGQDVQSKDMLGYVLASKDENGEEDTRFQQMMLSTMLSAKTTKAIDKQVNKRAKKEKLSDKDKADLRFQMIKEAAQKGQQAKADAAAEFEGLSRKEQEKAGGLEAFIRKRGKEAGLSKYGRGTVGEFFTGGNEDLDAGMVALGSASHMIEDSYAGSHASRAENLYLGDDGRKATALSETGQAIADKSTDVITAGDYNQQDANPIWGRHPKGDAFHDEDSGKSEDEIVDDTRGGALARDAAAQFMIMNAREKHGGAGGANDFIKQILKADDYAAGLEGGVTRTGSAYAKKIKGSTFNLKESIAADAFRDTTEARAENTHSTPSQLAENYGKRLNPLRILRGSKREETKEHYTRQTNEALAHINSMIQQLEKAKTLSPENQKALESLIQQRTTIFQQLNRERG